MQVPVSIQKRYEVDVDVAKRIRMYQNGIWKLQPHLEFFWNMCHGKKMWFDFHVKCMEKNGETMVNGTRYKLVGTK